ncbi:MAG: DUF362 domain-containing protein [Candidatus Hadarchaeota archaeon]
MSEVYFLKTDSTSIDLNEDIEKIFEKFSNTIDPKDRVAIKMHFGERKNETHLNPNLIRPIYERVDENDEETTLMDCTVLYKSERSIASTHLDVAKSNGFDFAPIEIADGEKGEKELREKIDLKHFNEVKLGEGLKDYNYLLSIAHFTGHDASGVGGALKNIGMGLGSKSGKLEMHEAFNLEVNEEDCITCGTCVENCPEEAITLEANSAVIDREKCIGCGMCIAVCPEGAVVIPWDDSTARNLQEKIVEYAYGALKDRKSHFVNVLFNITPDCDCVNKKQEPIVEDKGILISQDIVSIDQASIDLVGRKNLEFDLDPEIQMEYAEEIGMGERDYELIEI